MVDWRCWACAGECCKLATTMAFADCIGKDKSPILVMCGKLSCGFSGTQPFYFMHSLCIVGRRDKAGCNASVGFLQLDKIGITKGFS